MTDDAEEGVCKNMVCREFGGSSLNIEATTVVLADVPNYLSELREGCELRELAEVPQSTHTYIRPLHIILVTCRNFRLHHCESRPDA